VYTIHRVLECRGCDPLEGKLGSDGIHCVYRTPYTVSWNVADAIHWKVKVVRRCCFTLTAELS
jgi:hypothetical protein